MCEINSFLLFIFSLMIDSLIKQQTTWSQGSSKYQKQKKCTRSEISRVLLIDNLLITSLIPILLFEYFKEKS
jgi:dynactin complex subunit